MNKRIWMKAILPIILSSTLFALGEKDAYIVDTSGEYVWYADSSFNRESYIGYLCYDEKTYQVRYYSPGNKKSKAPLMVALYFTISNSKGYIEITGEKIESAKTSDDVAIINYLHDSVIELAKARGDIAALKDVQKKGGYNIASFGGAVDILFDNTVPIFNILYVEDNKANKVLDVIATGRVLNANDKSFENFKGFTSMKSEKHTFSPGKKTQSVEYNDGVQCVTLDSLWTPLATNSFVCGNVANLTYALAEGTADTRQIRRLLQSTNGVYKNWKTLQVKKSADEYKITCDVYDFDAKCVMFNVIKLKNTVTDKGNAFYYFSMSVMLDVYDKNKKYFDAICATYDVAQF